MRLTTRLVLLFFLLSFLPVLVVGYLAFENGRRAIEDNLATHLMTTTSYKQDELTRWIDNGQEKLAILAQRPLVREYTASLLAAEPGGFDFQSVYGILQSDHLLPNLRDGNYSSFSIMDASDGRIVLSTEKSLEGKYRESESFFLEGLHGPFVDEVRYFPSEDEISLHISAPILDGSGRVVAVLVGHANLDVMSEIMQQGRELLVGEETYVVNPAYFFVTEPWLGQAAVLKSTARTEGVTDCLDGVSGFKTYTDYRDVQVIGAYRWMTERRLCIITEIDQEQALQPVVALRNQVLVLGLLSAAVMATLGYLIAGSITRPITMLMNGAVEIGGGNLDYRVEPLSNDEIGQLGEAFNGMAASLAEAHRANSLLVAELEARGQDLESRVEKRTEELKAAQAATLNSMQVVERANAALRQEKAFTDQVINSIPGIFYVFDQTGKFISWNDNFSKISGYSDDEIAVMHPVQLFRGEDQERVAARIQKVFEDGVADVEADLTTKSGQGIPYFFTGLRTIIEGEPTLIGTGFDITDRKRAETELKKSMDALSRSNAELERFAYVASHDLQEPLRMVTSYLQLLERRYKDRLDGDALEFIAYAVDGSNRMKTLINDLLAYSRMGTRGKEFAPTDCEGVLARVLKNLEVAIAETKASITHDPLPQVLGDDVQLESLLQNLIGNSLKFRGKQKPKIHIGAEQDGDRWVFSVRDNGIGIDPQYFERIFIIFQRLHNREEYSGTGIGLAISKRIVERHGGRIWIESKPGAGATFYFTIPDTGEKK